MATWTDLDRAVREARDAANHHDSARALEALDASLALLGALPPPAGAASRLGAVLRTGLQNARDAVWAMLYDQAFMDLDLVCILPAALASGAVDEAAVRERAAPYLARALEPFRGRIQRAI
jgi:hypothetical protein